MQAINDLVRSVAVIVLIAAFLEMLLPASEMKRFTKMVMGLLILVSILNPLLNFFNRDLTEQVFAWQDSGGGTELDSILKKGEILSRDIDDRAADLYTQSMERQVETIVRLVKGVAWAKADVELDRSEERGRYCTIKRVVVVAGVGEKNTALDRVEPVEIQIIGQEQTVDQAGDPGLKQQVTESLSSFFNLQEDQIHVVMMPQ